MCRIFASLRSNTRIKRIVTTAALPKQTMFLGFIPGHRFLLENVKESLRIPGEFYLDRPTHVLTYLPMSGESDQHRPRLLRRTYRRSSMQTG